MDEKLENQVTESEDEDLDAAYSGYTLVLKFEDNGGDPVTFRYKYINGEVTATQVKNLMQKIVENCEIFNHANLVKLVSAHLVFTEDTTININI